MTMARTNDYLGHFTDGIHGRRVIRQQRYSNPAEITDDDLHSAVDVVAHAAAALVAGEAVLLLDDSNPSEEPDGYLAFAGETASTNLMAFAVRHSSGYIYAAVPEDIADRLQIPPMWHSHGTQGQALLNYCVTIDASSGISTGISAADRAHTIRQLANPRSVVSDFRRPGHVLPLTAKSGGVLQRTSPPEAITNLAAMAGMCPVGVLAQLVSEERPADMARSDELRCFADRRRLAIVSITDIVNYRWRHETLVHRLTETRIPVSTGDFIAINYKIDNHSHVALVLGDLGDGCDVSVYTHSACLIGDIFESESCRCQHQLRTALDAITAEGRGVIVYLRDSNAPDGMLPGELSGFRHQHISDHAYRSARQIIQDLGIQSVRVLTEDTTAAAALAECGLTVTQQVPLTRSRLSEEASVPHSTSGYSGGIADPLSGTPDTQITPSNRP